MEYSLYQRNGILPQIWKERFMKVSGHIRYKNINSFWISFKNFQYQYPSYTNKINKKRNALKGKQTKNDTCVFLHLLLIITYIIFIYL